MGPTSGIHIWLPPLDADPGPANRISRSKAATIVATAMSFETKSRIDVRRPPARARRWAKVAILSAAAFALPVTVVAGAVRFASARHTVHGLLAPIRTQLPPTEPGNVLRATEVVTQAALEAPTNSTADAPPAHVAAVEPLTKVAAPGRAPVIVNPRDLLQQANDLRAQHQWLGATELYEKTVRMFPGGAEAYSATVAAGMLHLDQLGDPKGALALFSSAIRARPRGSLAEEARWGAIQSHRALGDRIAEKAALQEFVTSYPQSLLALRAIARLRELRGDEPSP
jgi:hypothetical protein